VLLIMLAATHAASQGPVLGRLMYQGMQLNPDQAAAIEQRLTIIPDDLSAHIALIYYYCARVEAKSVPSIELSNDSRHHWERAMEAHPQHTAVLEHAASALVAIDPNLAPAPARRVVDLDPKCTVTCPPGTARS
jgi:hypothetical protein